MTNLEQPKSAVFDVVKLVSAVILVVAGVVGYHYFAQTMQLFRVLGVVGVTVIAMVIVYTTDLGRLVLRYLADSRTEVRKMVWPTRQETTQATFIVVILVFVVGIFLWLLDMVLFWGVRALTDGV